MAVSGLREHAEWMTRHYPERWVGCWERGDVLVSTIFLGLDHNFWGDGPPLLFETMILGGRHDRHQVRCSTYDEAERNHELAMRLVMSDEEIET